MSEFNELDAKDWLRLALEKHCSVSDAIYYSLFFQCRRDPNKFSRALDYFHLIMGIERKPEEFE